MKSSADRNLLFGILALQMDFISRNQLIEAMNGWMLDKSKTLGELLVKREHLATANCQLLESLVDAHVAQHGGQAEASLASLPVAASVAKELNELGDPDVQSIVQYTIIQTPEELSAGSGATGAGAADVTVDAHSPAAEPAHVESVEERPETGDGDPHQTIQQTLIQPPVENESRYRILRPFAEGGLGQVSIAMDEELNREVAFKEIKLRHVRNESARSRFVVEAEVTGGLEHPGIVPVYGFGEFDDGRPYYAMRFIRGETLLDALLQFHEMEWNETATGETADESAEASADTSSDSTRASSTTKAKAGESSVAYSQNLEFRGLINHFIDVCHAIEYAHSRSVLHRDLKPANIMLGNYGETLVVDWGLAKASGTTEPTADGELPLNPASGSHSAATQAGSLIGTPSFMSPEQAEGRIEQLGPASDVYSLGATLFQVLTGQPPAGARPGHRTSEKLAVTELLKRVRKGKVPRPSEVNPHVPSALDAVCLKAMALRPGDRYPSARAFGEDLEAWLADEPVSAWQEPWTIRARRWARRHPAIVSTGVSALAIGLVAFAIGFAVVSESHESERLAKIAAEKSAEEERLAKDEAKAAKAEAVDRFRDARDAVETSLVGISEALRDFPGVQEARRQLLQKAADDYARFAEDKSDIPELRAEAARALVRLGNVQMTVRDFREARASFDKARSRLQTLTEELPGEVLFRFDLAIALGRLASACFALGESDAAEQSLGSAMESLKKLAAADEKETKYRVALAEIGNWQAQLLAERGEFDRAIALLRDSARQFRNLIAERGAVSGRQDGHLFRKGLATTLNRLAAAQSGAGLIEESRSTAEDAATIWTSLVEEDEDRPDFLSGRAASMLHLMAAAGYLGHEGKELIACDGAIDDYRALVDVTGDVPRHRLNLGLTVVNLARVNNRLGNNSFALEAAVVAERQLWDLIEELPLDREYLAEGAAAISLRARIESELGNFDIVLDGDEFPGIFDEVIGQWDQLIEDHPGVPRYREDGAICRGNYGRALFWGGRLEEAAEMLELARSSFALALAEMPPGADPESDRRAKSYLNDGLAHVLVEMGNVALASNESEIARQNFQAAIDVRRKLPPRADSLRKLAELLANCPEKSLRNPKAAVAAGEQAVRLAAGNRPAFAALGMAQFRAGSVEEAIVSLKKARKLKIHEHCLDGYFLALALKGRNGAGDAEEARREFDAAAKIRKTHGAGHGDWKRIHQEAARALGVSLE